MVVLIGLATSQAQRSADALSGSLFGYDVFDPLGMVTSTTRTTMNST